MLVPAYNEAPTIAASVRALLQLRYSEFEIIVINDGSQDATLETLVREFGFEPFPGAYRVRLPTACVRGMYLSSQHPNLWLVDKENGGKADALNAGINAARYPIFCAVDADSVLQRDSLQRIVKPMMDDPSVVACGGTIRIINGCQVDGGYLVGTGLSKNILVRFQLVEYLRAFLFGRLGWVPLNALLIISGAFGVFRRDAVIEAGGYRTDTVGEDMELIVRLHRVRRAAGKPCRITFVPDPICWTEAPESLRVLKSQRVRWQRGLSESLWMNRGLLFHPRGGAAGWLAFPFMLIFEWAAPLIELTGYLFMALAYAFGLISFDVLAVFLFVALGLGVLLSVSALLLEEMSFHIYTRPGDTLRLFGAALLENFGYRQLVSLWRLIGLWQWIRRQRGGWGRMTRQGHWQQKDSA
jgi:cellulose synthase/poly-beta-1,6-N-acetylglucosamine synthase-like glycosyltransferase